MTILALGTALCLAAIETGVVSSKLWNPLAWVGRNSYEIYLTHGCVMILGAEAFIGLGSNINSAPFWHLAMVSISACLGWVIAKYDSEPLNRRLRGLG